MADADTSAQVAALQRLPDDIRASLTCEQVERLSALMATQSQHALAWRASTSLLGRKFYLAVVSGKETRSMGRLRSERLSMPLMRLLLRIIIAAAWITSMVLLSAVAGIVLLYLIKSHLGIDLMDGPSPLHQFFF
jgi:hypothetical protein